jgi:hypothetical protein
VGCDGALLVAELAEVGAVEVWVGVSGGLSLEPFGPEEDGWSLGWLRPGPSDEFGVGGGSLDTEGCN